MEKKEEVVEDEDNGPPPGWELTPQLQPLQTSTPPSGTQQALLAGESFLFYSDSKCPCLHFSVANLLWLIFGNVSQRFAIH